MAPWHRPWIGNGATDITLVEGRSYVVGSLDYETVCVRAVESVSRTERSLQLPAADCQIFIVESSFDVATTFGAIQQIICTPSDAGVLTASEIIGP